MWNCHIKEWKQRIFSWISFNKNEHKFEFSAFSRCLYYVVPGRDLIPLLCVSLPNSCELCLSLTKGFIFTKQQRKYHMDKKSESVFRYFQQFCKGRSYFGDPNWSRIINTIVNRFYRSFPLVFLKIYCMYLLCLR